MKIRKGKNIYFKLSVYKGDNSPEDFSKASDVKVIITGSLGRSYVPDVEIEGNILSFEFPGTKNEYPGTYGISLSYTKKNPNSVTGIEPFVANPYISHINGLVISNDRATLGGNPNPGISKIKDIAFKFKEYLDPNSIMLLSLDGPVNEPFTEEEIKYLEEQQLNK